MTQLQPCLDSAKYAAQIRNDLADANVAGARGTPAFFLGLTDPTDPKKFKATRQIRGAEGYSGFQANIDALLAEQESRLNSRRRSLGSRQAWGEGASYLISISSPLSPREPRLSWASW